MDNYHSRTLTAYGALKDAIEKRDNLLETWNKWNAIEAMIQLKDLNDIITFWELQLWEKAQ